jgi:Helicase conserved C-terminal domain
MIDHIANRSHIINFMKRELMGPDPQGPELDFSTNVSFDHRKDTYGSFREKGSGEEILTRDYPLKRYGVGILFCPDYRNEFDDEQDLDGDVVTDKNTITATLDSLLLKEKATRDLDKMQKRDSEDNPGESSDIHSANSYRPSSIALSMLARLPQNGRIRIEVTGGRYISKTVRVEKSDQYWWLRRPVRLVVEAQLDELLTKGPSKIPTQLVESENLEELSLSVRIISRPTSRPHGSLLTVCLLNQTIQKPESGKKRAKDCDCLFQTGFSVAFLDAEGSIESCIYPYPNTKQEYLDDEERALEMLYRNKHTFAVGHGCAATWEDDGAKVTSIVHASCLPIVETPSVTPEVLLKDGSPLEVPMASLAGLIEGEDGMASLMSVIEGYKDWIRDREKQVSEIDPGSQDVATKHLDECRNCAERMLAGLACLDEDPQAKTAFQLANHAVLLQQIRYQRRAREPKWDARRSQLSFPDPFPIVDPLKPPSGRGMWRPFQAAFILMNIPSVTDGDHPDRENLELIWFPTGGGKTEAYLGLAAYSIFLRRLRDPKDTGVNVIMRYTLRLLTTQQFQRAASLLTAMEYLRAHRKNLLGDTPISIGIWLGGSSTPNSLEDAVKIVKILTKGFKTKNKLVMTRCPWCGARMGPVKLGVGRSKKRPNLLGFDISTGDQLLIHCPDSRCFFYDHGLKIHLNDDDVYRNRPDLIIGTVDKFAMLTWRPNARALFGLNDQGERFVGPPSLIIQDELHLISGPLGTIVGLYEGLIEHLCTDNRGDSPVKPKMIASTATIRRFREQAKALYDRDQTTLFPPPGLLVDDSYFARFARDEKGKMLPGRIYMGIHATGFGSLATTQAHVFAGALQAPMELEKSERDPWWTLLTFFNSLRALGQAVSLVQSRVTNTLLTLRTRLGLNKHETRSVWIPMELTGRLAAEDIPKTIDELEIPVTPGIKNTAVDICLASNIIEVGVDIDRLSVMVVVGQPKTTAQYIQVTGRIGRSWRERPGLVLTILSPSNPRDRSHFERFVSYHQQLYAQVEPTSVTPFSRPSLDRALHGVLVAYVRQHIDRTIRDEPYPVPNDLILEFRDLYRKRVCSVDPEASDAFEDRFAQLVEEWHQRQRTKWRAELDSDEPGLIYQAGAYADPRTKALSWPTAMSMRNVDKECRVVITSQYIRD